MDIQTAVGRFTYTTSLHIIPKGMVIVINICDGTYFRCLTSLRFHSIKRAVWLWVWSPHRILNACIKNNIFRSPSSVVATAYLCISRIFIPFLTIMVVIVAEFI